jgi:hypothetical protein
LRQAYDSWQDQPGYYPQASVRNKLQSETGSKVCQIV